MTEVLRELPALAAAHLRLALVALVLATAASVPLGIAAARRPRLASAVLGVVGVVQTVPSLALLAIMVPALAALGAWLEPRIGAAPPAIGVLPATIALTLYGMLPIVANVIAGLRGVDPAVLEAADGVGMTRGERLRRVELPLAAPVVVAGLRTATVWVVGAATLATPIGASSLGNLIFAGLQTRNVAAIAVGCLASAALAIALDRVVAGLERSLRGGARGRRLLATGLALAAGGLALGLALGGGERVVRIGAKPFTEQAILAEILAARLERETGTTARVLPSLGSTVLFDGLAAGEIDLAVDYSGTLWTTILDRDDVPDRGSIVSVLRDELARARDVRVVAALGFENAYALAIARQVAEARGLVRLGDLARHAPELRIGGDYEFFGRREWQALRAAYGLEFRERRVMDPSLLYAAAAAGAVDVVAAYTSDGRIEAFDLVVLEDERAVIPPYDALVLASGEFERGRPAAIRSLRDLAGRIPVETMRALNAAVDRDGESPRAVASRWLDQLDETSATSASNGS
jgi:osmoprotectant transport system permease protein